MNTHSLNFKIRLGLFIIGGIAILVFALFIIGKQKNLFDPVFKLTTNFYNVSGLQVGNNVRFSGINVGTVDNIVLINDTAVRVDLMIKKDVWQFIKSDCKVTLGSEGIIGDKLLIITQGSIDAPLAKENQRLESLETIETNTIMARLDVTTANAEAISRQLSDITYDINEGHGTLSRLIQDSILAENLNQTIANLNRFSRGLIGTDIIMASLKKTASNAEVISQQLAVVMYDINNGNGTLGRLIQDTTIAENLNQTIINLKTTSKGLTGTDTIMAKMNKTITNVEVISKQLAIVMNEINKGNGTISRLINDSVMAENLSQAIINLKSSSKGLDDNMTAVKHNFLFRRYFERKAREAKEKKELDAIENNTE